MSFGSFGSLGKLLPDAVRQALPPLRSTEGQADPLVVCKFFTPDAGWTWYVLEFDGVDEFFGYVAGHACELGSFSLRELAAIRGPYGLAIERDGYFTPTPLSVVRRWHEGG